MGKKTGKSAVLFTSLYGTLRQSTCEASASLGHGLFVESAELALFSQSARLMFESEDLSRNPTCCATKR